MAYRLKALEPFLALPEPYKCATCPYCNGTRDATVKYPKPAPFDYFRDQLGSPKTVVAPMVDQSELPFRMLCRKYKADLAYTPMFNSRLFAVDPEYRKQQWSTTARDRPLVVQFCGSDADTVLAAARLVENDCDAVDLNLGCPQGIARKGHYGAFLMEYWDEVHTVLHTLSVELKVPVFAKIRRFDTLDLTLRYARMVRDAGVHLIAVHGRTREQKGQQTGMADLSVVAAVKQHITSVPVIANGNILTGADVAENLKTTGCDAVMCAEGLLWDPRLFACPERPLLTGRGFQVDRATRLDGIRVAREYVAMAAQFPTPFPNVKSHVFKMLHHSLEALPELRPVLGDMTKTTPLHELGAFLDRVEAEELARGPVGVYTKREKVRRTASDVSIGAGDDAEGAAAAAAAAPVDAAATAPADAAAVTATDAPAAAAAPVADSVE